MNAPQPYDDYAQKLRSDIKDVVWGAVLASVKSCIWITTYDGIFQKMEWRVRDAVWDVAWSVYDEIRNS